MTRAPRLPATYLLPLRVDAPRLDLGAYLAELVHVVDVVVVDASPPEVFAAHRAAWPPTVVHVPLARDVACANGKVRGVVTGLRYATHDAVVIADDDVRYTAQQLATAVALLEAADAVVPQNYFSPLPWHALWDTARTLMNRALAYDYPGTLVVRLSVLRATAGYDGDVLFENLELLRTIEAAGGVVRVARDLLVRRIPPTAAHFRNQRLRQAYDSFAQPPRLAVELALVPALVFAARRWGPRGPATLLLGGIAVAECGRRRGGGSAVFPPLAPLFAPAWLLERAACAWGAVAVRVLAGGVRYGPGRLRRAATPPRVLRARHGGAVRRACSVTRIAAAPAPARSPAASS